MFKRLHFASGSIVESPWYKVRISDSDINVPDVILAAASRFCQHGCEIEVLQSGSSAKCDGMETKFRYQHLNPVRPGLHLTNTHRRKVE